MLAACEVNTSMCASAQRNNSARSRGYVAMERTSAAIAAAEAKVASVLACLLKVEASQPAMASNAAPPGLGKATGNAPTPFPYPTSARKPADLRPAPAGITKKIADTDTKIACANKKMESAGAKIADTAPMSASAGPKVESAGATMESREVAPTDVEPKESRRIGKGGLDATDCDHNPKPNCASFQHRVNRWMSGTVQCYPAVATVGPTACAVCSIP